jgi:hypothetical protein
MSFNTLNISKEQLIGLEEDLENSNNHLETFHWEEDYEHSDEGEDEDENEENDIL